MRPQTNAQLARMAAVTAVLALILAVMIALGGAHNAVSEPAIRFGATVLMWLPFGITVVFLLTQQTSQRGRAVAWGPYVADTWFLVLVVCGLCFGTMRQLRTVAVAPLALGMRSAVILEIVVVGAAIFRMWQLHGRGSTSEHPQGN
jgi:hypothetical protein